MVCLGSYLLRMSSVIQKQYLTADLRAKCSKEDTPWPAALNVCFLCILKDSVSEDERAYYSTGQLTEKSYKIRMHNMLVMWVSPWNSVFAKCSLLEVAREPVDHAPGGELMLRDKMIYWSYHRWANEQNRSINSLPLVCAGNSLVLWRLQNNPAPVLKIYSLSGRHEP